MDRQRWRRIKYAVFVLLLVAMINLPLLSALSDGAGDDAVGAGGAGGSGPTGPSGLMWTVTALLDFALLGFAVLLARTGRYAGGDALHATALASPVPATTARGIEELGGEEVRIRGDVLAADAEQLVLDVDGRPVVVALDGHPCDIGRGRVADVLARRV